MSNGKTYHVGVEQIGESGNTHLASAYGDLDVLTYIGRKVGNLLKDAPNGAQFAVHVVETQGIEGGELRTVIEVTADGDVAAYVLAKKLRSERVSETVDAVTAE
jgi:hypothetical protein